ncbi:MAG: aspartyl protease family protein [Microcystaceae cyanobacterium]
MQNTFLLELLQVGLNNLINEGFIFRGVIKNESDPLRLVDTGSSYTLLRLNLLKSLGCDLQKPLRQMRTTTAGGIIEAPVVSVPWFSCLGQRVDSFPIVAYTLPATTFVEGLLGMDFLRIFTKITCVTRKVFWAESDSSTHHGNADVEWQWN